MRDPRLNDMPSTPSSSRHRHRAEEQSPDHAAMRDAYSSYAHQQQLQLFRRNLSHSPAPSSSTSYYPLAPDAGLQTANLRLSTPPSRRDRSASQSPFQHAPLPVQQQHQQASHHPQAQQVPSPQPPPPTPPPVSIHRVFVIRCASCDMFLSDRGMRAVLLLKPNIVLFSTDAAPTNASPMYQEGNSPDQASPQERTCECLTSSLGCHGCGSVIGYQIVQPCARCTASVQRHQRSANHHRYVFHHNEVAATERRYHRNEAGVVGPRHHRPSSSRATTPVPVSPDPDAKPGSRPFAAPAGRNEGTLRPGDTVYWHNLVPGGERPCPVDPKARLRPTAIRPGR